MHVAARKGRVRLALALGIALALGPRPAPGAGASAPDAGTDRRVPAPGADYDRRVQAPGADYDRRVQALAARVEAVPANAALATAIASTLPEVGSGRVASRVREAIDALALAPLRVPGLFHERHAWTGADLAQVERWLGRPVPAVPTGEVAPVSENAVDVRAAIREAAAGGRRVLLFSASKGSADVQEALAGDDATGACVAVWIDIVGVREGTPLTDPARHGAELARLGLPDATARSMLPSARLPSARAPLAPGTEVVHVAAFPTRAHVSEAARPGFGHLWRLGPNDGFVLLEPYLHAPGRVVVVREADHYLRSPTLGPRVLAALDQVLRELEAAPEAAARARRRCRAAP